MGAGRLRAAAPRFYALDGVCAHWLQPGPHSATRPALAPPSANQRPGCRLCLNELQLEQRAHSSCKSAVIDWLQTFGFTAGVFSLYSLLKALNSALIFRTQMRQKRQRRALFIGSLVILGVCETSEAKAVFFSRV